MHRKVQSPVEQYTQLGHCILSSYPISKLSVKDITLFNGGPLILLSKLYPEGFFLFSLCCLQFLK